MQYQYDQIFVVDSQNEDQKFYPKPPIQKKTKNMGLYTYIPAQMPLIPIDERPKPRKFRGTEKPIIKQYIDIDAENLQINDNKNTRTHNNNIDVFESPEVVVKLEDGQIQSSPTAPQIRMAAFEMRKKFPNDHHLDIIAELHSLIINDPKCLQKYLDKYQQDRINKQLLKMFIADQSVSSLCQIVLGLLPKDPNRDSKQTQYEALELVRLKLSTLIRDSMFKFNEHAKKFFNPSQIDRFLLTREQINKIIEAGSALGVECKILLCKYYLNPDPSIRQFETLLKKMHDQLKPIYKK